MRAFHFFFCLKNDYTLKALLQSRDGRSGKILVVSIAFFCPPPFFPALFTTKMVSFGGVGHTATGTSPQRRKVRPMGYTLVVYAVLSPYAQGCPRIPSPFDGSIVLSFTRQSWSQEQRCGTFFLNASLSLLKEHVHKRRFFFSFRFFKLFCQANLGSGDCQKEWQAEPRQARRTLPGTTEVGGSGP